MAPTQSHSTAYPLDHRVIAVAIEFILKADSMGLLAEPVDTLHLDIDAIIRAAKGVTKWGIGRRLVIDPERWRNYTPDDLCGKLKQLSEIIEDCPHPETEWQRLRELLTDSLVATMTGVSEQSVRRYASEERVTPVEVAARLHWLALTTGDLQGAYNDDGVRNWFQRPRKSFADKSPLAILGSKSWSPSDENAMQIRKFARDLTESMGT
jgi:hypothetical protein